MYEDILYAATVEKEIDLHTNIQEISGKMEDTEKLL